MCACVSMCACFCVSVSLCLCVSVSVSLCLCMCAGAMENYFIVGTQCHKTEAIIKAGVAIHVVRITSEIDKMQMLIVHNSDGNIQDCMHHNCSIGGMALPIPCSATASQHQNPHSSHSRHRSHNPTAHTAPQPTTPTTPQSTPFWPPIGKDNNSSHLGHVQATGLMSNTKLKEAPTIATKSCNRCLVILTPVILHA